MADVSVSIVVTVEGKPEPVKIQFNQALKDSLDLDKLLQNFSISGDVVVRELVHISGIARSTP